MRILRHFTCAVPIFMTMSVVCSFITFSVTTTPRRVVVVGRLVRIGDERLIRYK